MTTLLEAIFEAVLAGADQSEVIEGGAASYVDDQLRSMTPAELLELISDALDKAGYDLTPVPSDIECCGSCGGSGYAHVDGMPTTGTCSNCHGKGEITGPPYGGTVSCGRCRGTGQESKS